MLKSIKKAIWPITLVSVIIAVPFFIFGILQAFQVTQGAMQEEETANGENRIEERSEEIEEVNDGGHHILTLGDSLARGTGDEEGLGFAGRTVQKLDEFLDVPIIHDNYAVEGFRISEMLELLNNNEFQEELQHTDMIMISIGGNDVRSIRGLPASEWTEAYQNIEEGYQEALEETIRRIREANPGALVVFLGLYNLDYSDESPEETEFLLRWNAITYQMIEKEQDFVWIPTYDLFQFQLTESLSPDLLHPNGAGYEKIANRIIEVIMPFFTD